MISLLLFLVWTLPAGICLTAINLLAGRSPLVKMPNAEAIGLYVFRSSKPSLRAATLFFYVLTGKLKLCGRSIAVEAPPPPELLSYKPAVFSPWTLYHRCRIGILSKTEVELEYCRQQSFGKDVKLLLKSAFAAVFFSGPEAEGFEEHLSIGGIPFLNTTLKEAVDTIVALAGQKAGENIFFINPHCLNIARNHPVYARILRDTRYVYPDGSGIVMACQMLNTPLKENVNGTDLFPKLCVEAEALQLRLYLLGGREGVAETMRQKLLAEYPKLQFAGLQHGFFKPEERDQVIAAINQSGADILLVAMGVPGQEIWLFEQRDKLTVPVRLGVGGLFDFYSGRIPRAPLWLREIGMEWTYRLLMEPTRMAKRYLIGNVVFLYHVMLEKRRRGRKS